MVGDLVLDESSYELHGGHRRIMLTPTEFRLLRYLGLDVGRALPREQALSHLWRSDSAGEGSIVETCFG